MPTFVATRGNGLARALIEADDATEALERLLAGTRLGLAVGIRDELEVREATEAELADFAARGRRVGAPAETMTLPIDLPPARARRKIRSTDHS